MCDVSLQKLVSEAEGMLLHFNERLYFLQ